MAGRGLTILRNLSALTLGKIAGDVLAFGFFVFLSRKLGTEGLGEYSFAMALTGFAGVAADFGIYYQSIKEIAQRRGSDVAEEVGRAQSVRVLLALAVAAVFAPIAAFVPMSDSARITVLLLCAYHLFQALATGYVAVLVAEERMSGAGLADVLLRGGSAVVASAVLMFGGGLHLAAASFPVVALLVLLALHGWGSRTWGKVHFRFRRADVVDRLRRTAPYGLSELLQHLATRIDVVLLGSLVGADAAGVYNAALRVVVFVQMLAWFVGMSVFPAAARAFVEDRQAYRGLFRRIFESSVLLALPAAAGLALIAPSLITMLYAEEFASSIPVLRILSGLVLLSVFKHVLSVFLMSAEQQRKNLKVQWMVALVNAGANAVVVPMYGPLGAAGVALLSELLAVVLLLHFIAPFTGRPRVGVRVVAAVLGTLAFVSFGTAWPRLSVFVVLPISVVLFAGVIALFPAIRRDEIHFLRKSLPIRRGVRRKAGEPIGR